MSETLFWILMVIAAIGGSYIGAKLREWKDKRDDQTLNAAHLPNGAELDIQAAHEHTPMMIGGILYCKECRDQLD